MPEVSIPVGVIAERREIDHPWQDHLWEAVSVLSGVPDIAIGTVLSQGERSRQVYIGSAELVLATSETAQYRDNLLSPPPRLWVVAQTEEDHPRVTAVTADPAEGEAHTESGSSLVCVVPMAAEIASALAEFVDTHHVERVFHKRKRKRYDETRGEA